MTLTVGTDTYITLADAEVYIPLHYLSTDAKKIVWDSAPDGDKEIALRRSTQSIETIRYPGAKYDVDQTLAFPRVIPGVWPARREFDYDDCPYSIWWTGSGDVPDEIKYAEVEEALEILSPAEGTALKKRIKRGVTSVGIGHFKEAYQPQSMSMDNISAVLQSERARELLSRFKEGSYRVL